MIANLILSMSAFSRSRSRCQVDCAAPRPGRGSPGPHCFPGGQNGTKPGVNRRNHRWGGWLSIATGAGLLVAPGSLLGATFVLEYQTNGPSAEFPLPLEKSEIRFKNEPEYAGAQVVRSHFSVAPGPHGSMGFACDSEGQKLYLDLNRNLDLTDDPEGIRESRPGSGGREFPHISIPIEQAGRRREIAMDLQIYGENRGGYTIRSSWGSDAVDIGGKTYRAAVVDDGDGVIGPADFLFLEPVGDEFEAVGDPGKRVELQVPASLVLDGQPYALALALGRDGKSMELSIVPAAEELVDVPVTGKGLERLTLQNEGRAALFFAPESTIRLPAGRYRAEVWVRAGAGDTTSLWKSRRVFLDVREGNNPEPWGVGGPIVRKLTCSMAGSCLTFDQAATGAAGETYSLVNAPGQAPEKPKLRIRHEGEIIHVGEFEYG